MVRVIRDDEAGHRDVNHQFADLINSRKSKKIVSKEDKAKKENREKIFN